MGRIPTIVLGLFFGIQVPIGLVSYSHSGDTIYLWWAAIGGAGALLAILVLTGVIDARR
jgi:hypothetical protein